MLLECRRRYGSIFTMRLGAIGTAVLVSEPEHIRQIFTGDPDQLHAGEANVVLRPLVGDYSVLLLDGAEHLRHRRLMLPPFHGERMRLYGATMQAVSERTFARWPEGEAFRLHSHAQSITLEVIMRTVFGLSDGPELDDLADALRRLLSRADSRSSQLMMLPALQRDWGAWSPYGRFMRDRARADDLIYHVIARRRRAREQRDDVLALLLAAADEQGRPLGDVELRDELMTLLVAGHETTATALCWLVERVLSHPDVHARVLRELDEVLDGARLGPDHFARLDYLDAVIRETLRLRPVIPLVGRMLTTPLALGGYDLPAGVVIAPSIYLTHRDPALYPEPEAFRPERFLGTRIDPYAWLPFGGGIRRCLGMSFALYELKVVAATLFSQMSLELAQATPVRIVRRSITFAPELGTRIVARRGRPRREARRADFEPLGPQAP
jgi:cytochrome P450